MSSMMINVTKLDHSVILQLTNLSQECLPVLLILSHEGVEVPPSQKRLHLCLVATILDVHRYGHGLQDRLAEEILIFTKPLDGTDGLPVSTLERIQSLGTDVLHSLKLVFS